MERLKDQDILRFCAIPQVMAIATLAKVYNNANVFTGESINVSIPKTCGIFCDMLRKL